MTTTSEGTDIHHFIPFSILSSTSSIVFYLLRYSKFNDFQRHERPKDLTNFTVVLIGLSIWNIVLCIAIRYLIDLSTRDIESQISILIKDISTSLIILVSMFLSCKLCDSILACIEFISSYSIESDEESQSKLSLQGKKTLKFVSFYEELETFSYSESSLKVLHSKVSSGCFLGDVLNRGAILRNTILFIIVFIISVLLLPDILLLNSTIVILSISTPIKTEFKFEHIYFAMLVVFARQVIGKFTHLVSQPKTSHFPKSTLILSSFTWTYICITMTILMIMIIISDDILFNVYKMILMGSPLDSYLNTEYSLNVFTYNILGYLGHIISPSSVESIELKWSVLLGNCSIVLSTSCFSILPLILWVCIVECKIRSIKNKL